MEAEQPIPDTTPPAQQSVVVDRRALQRLIGSILVAILAVFAVAMAIGYARIAVLEDGLAERRAVRDREAAANAESQERARQVICVALNHLNDPDDPELEQIRRMYQCPGPDAADG